MVLKRGKRLSETRIMTPEFRLSFPHLFKAHTNFEGQEPKFSCSMLFDKDEIDLSLLKQIASDAIKKQWPQGKPKNFKSPFLDGDEKEYDGYENTRVVRPFSTRRPGLVDQQKTPITDESELYPGCYARAVVNAFPWTIKGKCGVSFGLIHIQKVRDGDMFGDGSKAEDDFDSLESDTNLDNSETDNDDWD